MINNQKLFERYFKMELTPKEVQDFKDKLSQNSDLTHQFHLYKLAHQKTMEIFHPNIVARKEKIKQDLLSFRQLTPKKQNSFIPIKSPPRRQLRFYQWLSAASILLLIIAGAFIFQQTSYDTSLALSKTENQIAAAINLDALGTLNRSGNSPVSTAILTKDFKTILQVYRDSKTVKEANILLLIEGIVYAQDKELEQAKGIFEEIIRSKKGQIDVAQWALVSVFLKQGDFDNAKFTLRDIKAPTNKKAKEILKLLPK